jgi:hypothetical protein
MPSFIGFGEKRHSGLIKRKVEKRKRFKVMLQNVVSVENVLQEQISLINLNHYRIKA